jgi:hypothetical protein
MDRKRKKGKPTETVQSAASPPALGAGLPTAPQGGEFRRLLKELCEPGTGAGQDPMLLVGHLRQLALLVGGVTNLKKLVDSFAQEVSRQGGMK